MSSTAVPKDGAAPRVSRKADAALTAAARPLPSSEHRSTADQQQAFLEHLYSDYSELHAQQGEIHDRKNQMDFDLFESNQQEIHDVLFANVEATDGALGDWDTWEKVEAVMKRFAYGRPRHTTQEKEEDVAMRSRIDALNEVVHERNAVVQALTQTCTASQQELGGLLKLLHMRGNELKTLSNQHHTAVLQLRYIQRECDALRGLRNEEDTSLLKQDLNYLIEANKKLEAENQFLRGRQQVVDVAVHEPPASTTTTAIEPPATQHSSGFVPLQPRPLQAIPDDVLDRCLTDDAFRRELMQAEIPLSGVVVQAKRQTAHWKRRLEAEVHSALEMLDRDAAAPIEAAGAASLTSGPWRGARQDGAAQLQNGVFISYASYDTAPRTTSEESSVPVLVAATTASAAAAVSSSPAPLPASPSQTADEVADVRRASAVSPTSPHPTVESRGSVPSETLKKHRKSTASSTAASHHPRGSFSKTTAAKKFTHAAVSESKRTSAAAVPTAAFAPLQSAILRCAELSRANAMRRELLHVAHLRQMLADEMARASAGVPATTNSPAATPPPPPLSQAAVKEEESLNGSAVDAASGSPPADSSLVQSPSLAEASASSVPQRLRQRVDENRTSSLDTQLEAVTESDGGEVQSSAAVGASSSEVNTTDRHRTPPLPARTPTPPPLSRQPSSRVGSSGGGGAGRLHTVSTTPTLDRLALPLRQHTSTLREEVAVLRAAVVTYWAELQEALGLLGRVFAERETHVAQAAVAHAEEAAMDGAAELVLEAAALQRTEQILKEHFGAVLPADAFAAAVLPESATDEEWLVHELHAAAAAMVKDAVHLPTAALTDADDAADGAAAAASAFRRAAQPGGTSSPPSSSQRPSHLSPAERSYFEAEILRPFRLQPNFGNGGATHRVADTEGGGARWPTVDATAAEESEAEARTTLEGVAAERRAAGGVDGRSRNRPAPPAQWHWRTRAAHVFGGDATVASAARPAVVPRRPAAFTSSTAATAASPSPASVQSIQPTVLRYVFGGAAESPQRTMKQQIKERTSYLYGTEFEGFVQEYVVPVISTASRISTGGKMSAAMRAAVQDLRQKERLRRKRGVQLLFDRVANNIRTRRLLQRNVYQGEAFVSYVGLLYGNWRTRLESERHRVESAQETNRNALFSLLQLRTTASPSDTLTKPAPPPPHPSGRTKPVAGSSKRTINGALTKSSFHFDKAKFNAAS